MTIVAVLVSLSFGCALSPAQKAECHTSHMAQVVCGECAEDKP